MENINKILDKKEKSILSKKDFIAKYPDFLRDIGEKKISEDGTVTLEKGNLKVSFQYEDLLANTTLEDLSRLDIVFAIEDSKAEDYFLLKSLHLKNENSEFDLMAEAGDMIFIYKKNPAEAIKGLAQPDDRVVSFNSSPTSPLVISTLFHELGHLKDPALQEGMLRISELQPRNLRKNDTEGKSHNDEISKEKSAIKLKQERTAWAYALNKLRPFLSDLDTSEGTFEKFVHDFSLGSYCKNIQSTSQ